MQFGKHRISPIYNLKGIHITQHINLYTQFIPSCITIHTQTTANYIQQVDEALIPSMGDFIEQHASLAEVKKIGEGVFGEAFKAGSMVFKIVPLDGDMIVNGETQKRSEDIIAEAAIATTLSHLRDLPGQP